MNTFLIVTYIILYVVLHLSCGIVAIAMTLLLNHKAETQPPNETQDAPQKSFDERYPTPWKKMRLFISIMVFGPIAIVILAFILCSSSILGIKDAFAGAR